MTLALRCDVEGCKRSVAVQRQGRVSWVEVLNLARDVGWVINETGLVPDGHRSRAKAAHWCPTHRRRTARDPVLLARVDG